MRYFRTHVIPLAGAVASFSAVEGQDEFALRNDADILGIVGVWRYDGALGVGGKQDVTVLRLQFERVERPVKWRKVTQQFRKMRHVLFYRVQTSPFSGARFCASAATACWIGLCSLGETALDDRWIPLLYPHLAQANVSGAGWAIRRLLTP